MQPEPRAACLGLHPEDASLYSIGGSVCYIVCVDCRQAVPRPSVPGEAQRHHLALPHGTRVWFRPCTAYLSVVASEGSMPPHWHATASRPAITPPPSPGRAAAAATAAHPGISTGPDGNTTCLAGPNEPCNALLQAGGRHLADRALDCSAAQVKGHGGCPWGGMPEAGQEASSSNTRSSNRGGRCCASVSAAIDPSQCAARPCGGRGADARGIPAAGFGCGCCGCHIPCGRAGGRALSPHP